MEPARPPLAVPSNCRFAVHDFTERWAFGGAPFDLIHLRMVGRLPGFDVVRSAYESLSPGGWCEFTEWIVVLQSPDGSLDGTPFQKWNHLVRQGT